MPTRQWCLVGLIYSLGVLVSASLALMGPLMANLATAIHGSAQSVGTAFGIMFLPHVLASTLVGRGADRIGTRNMLLFGAAMLFAAGISNLKVNSLVWLIVNNLVLGLGMITTLVAGQTALARETSGTIQAGVLSLWATAPYAGTTLGLWLSGSLVETPYWRLPFAIQGVLAVGLAAAIAFFIPPRPAGAAPIAHRSKLPSFVREYKVFRLCIGFMFVVISTTGAVAVWPLYLSKVHGAAIGTIAKLAALAQPTAILGSIVAGYLLSRALSPGKIVFMYTAGAILSVSLLLSSEANLRMVAAALILWALCGGAWIALNNAMLPRVVSDKDNIGAATGLLHQMAGVGAVISAPLYSTVVTLHHANMVVIAIVTTCWLVPALIMPIWRSADQLQPQPIQ
jgi:MFS family permease